MGKVRVELSISLDGFVAGPNDGVNNPLGDGGQQLFKWYSSGDTDLPLPGTDMVFKVSRISADFLRDSWRNIGAAVTGRRMFDIAGGWDGRPPGGVRHFVVTHMAPQEWVKEGSPFTFVTDGVESAVEKAKQVAGDKDVSISSATVAQQCIKAGLLDEIQIDLVSLLLGGGIRLFDHLDPGPIELERIRIVEAPDVTHLLYRIIK